MVKVGDTVKWDAGSQGMLGGKVIGGEKGKRWKIENKKTGKTYYVVKDKVKKGIVKKSEKKVVKKPAPAPAAKKPAPKKPEKKKVKPSQSKLLQQKGPGSGGKITNKPSLNTKKITPKKKGESWRGKTPPGLPPLPPPSSGYFYPPPDEDGYQDIGFVGGDYKGAETHPFYDKVKDIVQGRGDIFGYYIIGDEGQDKVDSQIRDAVKGMKLSKEDAKKFTDWAKKLSKKIDTDTIYSGYQERAKQVFEGHKRHFGQNHYAQVEIAGIGTVNWDGYKLYEKGLFSKGSYMGTYENEKDLKEWMMYGRGSAFTKYDPLELDIRAKGLNLLGFRS